jgi:hypothetical protein
MGYLFAAVIAVFAITADLESSNNHSIWVEPSFVIAAAQSEPAIVSTDTDNATVTATVESPSESNTTNNNAQDETPHTQQPRSTTNLCHRVRFVKQ